MRPICARFDNVWQACCQNMTTVDLAEMARTNCVVVYLCSIQMSSKLLTFVAKRFSSSFCIDMYVIFIGNWMWIDSGSYETSSFILILVNICSLRAIEYGQHFPALVFYWRHVEFRNGTILRAEGRWSKIIDFSPLWKCDKMKVPRQYRADMILVSKDFFLFVDKR